MANKLEPIGKSSTGMDENIAALVAVLFFPITSIIFYFIEKDSKFVKFHALQSAIFGVPIFILSVVLSCIGIGVILGLLQMVVWIILMIKTYQGEWFELPVIGKIAMDKINAQP